MSYEGRHWGCGTDRKDNHSNCQACKPQPIPPDCPQCGHVEMCCDCDNSKPIKHRRNSTSAGGGVMGKRKIKKKTVWLSKAATKALMIYILTGK